MFASYLSIYLVFLIVISVLVGFLVLRLNIPQPKLVIPLIIAAILAPAVLGYYYMTYFTAIPEVIVPNLRGYPIGGALDKLKELGLEGRFSGTVFDSKVPEGSVVSHRPEAGQRVKMGRTIKLLTSSGSRLVQVPNLLGRPAEQATAVLAAKGLQLGRVDYSPVPGMETGIILSQAPLPAVEVESGASVNLTISMSAEAEAEDEEQEEKAEGEEEKGGFWFW